MLSQSCGPKKPHDVNPSVVCGGIFLCWRMVWLRLALIWAEEFQTASPTPLTAALEVFAPFMEAQITEPWNALGGNASGPLWTATRSAVCCLQPGLAPSLTFYCSKRKKTELSCLSFHKRTGPGVSVPAIVGQECAAWPCPGCSPRYSPGLLTKNFLQLKE